MTQIGRKINVHDGHCGHYVRTFDAHPAPQRPGRPPLTGDLTLASAGRRERNKQVKLDRISAAACELFADRGVDEVFTQQIADEADIGTGTLFLSAKTKGAPAARSELSAHRSSGARPGGRRECPRRSGCGDGDRPTGRHTQPGPCRQRVRLPARDGLRRPH
ncbi:MULTISPECIES: helix-turn-helix domain-containing protein [unclassified Streptomyces]|uniref:helix-turn-helix domain-containing protein n=1 Tax=unclassified Streptomyces TaxID=2593676 RepID=UPI001F24D08D|nr:MULTISPECIES: helix-turn-helix domain-containing protein [unclassified Streptomyces]